MGADAKAAVESFGGERAVFEPRRHGLDVVSGEDRADGIAGPCGLRSGPQGWTRR
jgi:hypothetical protein